MLADGADENGEIVIPEHVRVALALGLGNKADSGPAERSFPRQQAEDMSAPETIAAL
jgi:hypothetical protein